MSLVRLRAEDGAEQEAGHRRLHRAELSDKLGRRVIERALELDGADGEEAHHTLALAERPDADARHAAAPAQEAALLEDPRQPLDGQPVCEEVASATERRAPTGT